MEERPGGLVVIEGNALGGLIKVIEGGLQIGVDGYLGQMGGKGLFGAEAQAVTPFFGRPEAAAGVGGVALLGLEEVDTFDSEVGRLVKHFTGGVGTRQADQEAHR